MHAVLHGIKFVNDLVAGFVSKVVNAGNVNEVIEPERVASVQADIAKGRSVDAQCALIAKAGLVDDGSGKSLAQPVGDFV